MFGRMSPRRLDEFLWPLTRSSWISRETPGLAAPVRDKLKVVIRASEIDLLDGGELLAGYAEEDVKQDATDDWVLTSGGNRWCELLSRRTRQTFAIGVACSFFDNRNLVGAPRWDTDGRHFWLPFGTHWERRAVPELDFAKSPVLDAAALPSSTTWTPVLGTEGCTLASDLMAPERAHQLWTELSSER